jgi:hypothetical protein
MANYTFKFKIGDLLFPNTAKEIETKLYGVRFNRKIYRPGEIEAEVNIYPEKTIDKLTTMLLGQKVTVTLQEDGKDKQTVAENYYVHEILPQKNNDTTGIYVKLYIYSMDKLATIDKYSKVYAVKKLGAEILNKERSNFTLGNEALSVKFDDLHMLKYIHTRNMTNSQTGKTISIQIPSEFIHPYLVQYNESFYDFLSRTANRCGEFLYFEDGRLNLGLTPSRDNNGQTVTKQITKKDYASVTYQGISNSSLDINRYSRDSMKDKWGVMENTNYDVSEKNAAGYPHDVFPNRTSYHSELASDEFFFPLYADKFSTYNREIGMDGTHGENAATQLFPKFADITANMSDIVDFAFKLTLDEGKTIDAAKKSATKRNKDGMDAYIKIGNTADRAKLLERGDGEKCAVPFGTLSKDGWTTLDYYRDVRKYEEQQQRDIICLDMGTNFIDVKLGDTIKLDGNTLYTVIQIVMVDNTTWNLTYTKYDGDGGSKTEKIQNQKIFAIPNMETKEANGNSAYKPYPPVLDVPVVRKAEPQTAFIADNNDPKYQGRVRIVYPWQNDSTGQMRVLSQAEADYDRARQLYLEKKERQEQLELELEALKKEKKLLDDNKLSKDNELKLINADLKKLNEDLKDTVKDENLKKNQDKIPDADKDVTQEHIDHEFKLVSDKEEQVEEKRKALEEKKAELLTKESEKTRLENALAEMNRQKAELSEAKRELELRKEKVSDTNTIQKLQEEIDNINNQLTPLDSNITTTESDIKTRKNDIKDLKEDKDNTKSILYYEKEYEDMESLFEKERERYELLQQKKAIQDYYASLDSTKKAYIDELIEEKDSSGKVTGGKQKEVNDAKDATTEAEKDMKEKEKVVEKAAKDVGKVISIMSSPWIRMTTPMATDGGGTLFKPRVGDEVLVNYECGNVERPYVVGSLFSKNVLEPDERINRTVGPALHSGASIAIVSPNGHGITFKDPSSGDGFVSSVYPGLGIVSKYSKGWGNKLPQAKDLAGGIRIGDRYGLYAIDMSSDKRSVRISSSLGTVKLDAFTGITITAPNGDVRIEGKNVTIKAGNNLDISSGNNIDTRGKLAKKFQWTGALDGVEGVGKKLASQFLKDFVSPFLDVSLARSVWEVILRPVEGTTLIKSRRFLKLEAGSGKAMIQHDRYTPNTKNILVNGSDKLKKTEDIIKHIVVRISEINSKITAFCNTYKTSWNNCFTQLRTYYHVSFLSLKKADDPDIWEEVSNLNHWEDDYFNDKFDGKLENGTDDQTKQAIIDAANAYGKGVYTLQMHIQSFEELYDPGNLANLSQEEQDTKNALMDAFNELKNIASTYWDKFYEEKGLLEESEPADVLSDPVFLKRKWAALFLKSLSDTKDLQGKRTYDFFFDCLGEVIPSDDTIKDNYKWNSYVSNLEKYKMFHPLLRSLFDTVIKKPLEDNFKPLANPVKDLLMWNEKEAGDILLSQDANCTVNFKGGHATRVEDANTGNLDYLKKMLYGLK